MQTVDAKFIWIEGELAEGDGTRFFNAVDRLIGPTTVILESPGGLVSEALQIGAEIRYRNLATMVLPDGKCFSACGLIWVSGVRRYLSSTSQIGFHAAYREENGEYRESGVANAEIGSFLTHLGLRIEAIRFFTQAGPDEFLMLTPETARALGIEVYENVGAQITDPSQAPTVDVYAYRFVSFATLRSPLCLDLLRPDPETIERGLTKAFNEGNKLVDSDKWIEISTSLNENLKAQLSSKGGLIYCIEAEARLRDQGLQTGISGPSFDCSKANTPTEKAMCVEPKLWTKDRAISQIYFWARNNVDPQLRRQILSMQRHWLTTRDSCGGDIGCLNTVYETRVHELSDISPHF